MSETSIKKSLANSEFLLKQEEHSSLFLWRCEGNESGASAAMENECTVEIALVILNVDITLPGLTATNVVTWKCHMNDSAKGRYDLILGRYLDSEHVRSAITRLVVILDAKYEKADLHKVMETQSLFLFLT